MAGSMVYRLRVAGTSDLHMASFINAMRQAQSRSDNESYNYIAGFHGAPGWYCWHHQFSRRTAATPRLFLPWHRAYLWWLEQALQNRVQKVALPWWDWTNQRGIPNSYSRAMVAGEQNPLTGSTMNVPNSNPPLEGRTSRRPRQPSFLPSPEEIEDLIDNTPDYASFNDALENYHDQLHGWVGGSMGSVTTAAFDPIFFAHHCMVDRIWYLWQVKHGFDRIPNSLLDLELVPFGKRVREVLDTQELGYEYASTAVNIDVSDMGGNNG